jgi:hypothetical protein
MQDTSKRRLLLGKNWGSALESFKANAMTKLDLDALRKAFPLEPIPKPSELTESFGSDVEDDLSVLEGRSWDSIKPQDFRFHFEVVCWLSPKAFRYYLPSIIKCSLEELHSDNSLSETELVVDYTLRMLVKTEIEEIEKRCQSIWKALSSEQIIVVRRWVQALATCPDALSLSAESLNTAINLRLD